MGACSTDFVTKNLVRMRPVSRQQSGSSPYLIDVSVGEQKVRIYHHGVLIKEWVASTGKDNSAPLVTIQNRADWFFNENTSRVLGGGYLIKAIIFFHSVPSTGKGDLFSKKRRRWENRFHIGVSA